MTFDHVVDAVEMTQQQGDSEEIRWDSKTGEKPPALFKRVSDQIGETISTITISAQGKETRRENNIGSKASLGMGTLAVAFPENPLRSVNHGQFLVTSKQEPIMARSRSSRFESFTPLKKSRQVLRHCQCAANP